MICKRITLSFLLLAAMLLNCNVFAKNNFLDQSKTGWWWFEEDSVKRRPVLEHKLTALEAEKIVQARKEELDGARLIMLAEPTDENIIAYRQLEAEAFKLASYIGKKWTEVNFTTPELHDRSIDPVNVHAIKIRREIEEKNRSDATKKFAEGYSLILFRKGSCRYCEEFEPVLASFAQKYKINIEAINMDNSVSKYFSSKKAPGLAENLGIQNLPTLILIEKGGKLAIEFSRGFLSLQELEETSKIAIEHLTKVGKLK